MSSFFLIGLEKRKVLEHNYVMGWIALILIGVFGIFFFTGKEIRKEYRDKE